MIVPVMQRQALLILVHMLAAAVFKVPLARIDMLLLADDLISKEPLLCVLSSVRVGIFAMAAVLGPPVGVFLERFH